MDTKRTATVALLAAALVLGGAGTVHADDGSTFRSSQILSCLALEPVDTRLLSSAPNNIDCSENHTEEGTWEDEDLAVLDGLGD